MFSLRILIKKILQSLKKDFMSLVIIYIWPSLSRVHQTVKLMNHYDYPLMASGK